MIKQPIYPNIHVQLTGRDGNAMTIISTVGAALRQAVSLDVADRWVADAFDAPSYDALLQLAISTVTVH